MPTAPIPLPGNLVESRVIGVNESIKKLRQYKTAAARGAARGVFMATEYNAREANKVTPIEKGKLRASQETHYAGSGFEKKGMISYNEYYAIYVHEDLTKYHEPPTMAKFLQRTVWANRGKTSEIIQGEITKEQLRARH